MPGTDIVYQDLVQKAQDMQQPDGTTESVRKAIAWLLTGGKMGEKGDDTLMGEVALAMQNHRPRPEAARHAELVRNPEDELVGFIRSKS
jgi:hypothetical protein